jgi:hypothetical protein
MAIAQKEISNPVEANISDSPQFRYPGHFVDQRLADGDGYLDGIQDSLLKQGMLTNENRRRIEILRKEGYRGIPLNAHQERVIKTLLHKISDDRSRGFPMKKDGMHILLEMTRCELCSYGGVEKVYNAKQRKHIYQPREAEQLLIALVQLADKKILFALKYSTGKKDAAGRPLYDFAYLETVPIKVTKIWRNQTEDFDPYTGRTADGNRVPIDKYAIVINELLMRDEDSYFLMVPEGYFKKTKAARKELRMKMTDSLSQFELWCFRNLKNTEVLIGVETLASKIGLYGLVKQRSWSRIIEKIDKNMEYAKLLGWIKTYSLEQGKDRSGKKYRVEFQGQKSEKV